jgi:type I restriction enzyme, S subunit
MATINKQDLDKLNQKINFSNPKNWLLPSLKSIVVLQHGYSFKSEFFSNKSGIPLLRIRDLDHNKCEIFYDGEYDEEFLVKKGDLLIGLDGNFHCHEWKGPDSLLNQRVCRVFVDGELLDKRFLQFGINLYLKQIENKTSSATVKHLSATTIKKINFPLTTINEQIRISKKITKLLDDVYFNKQSLTKIKKQLELWEQSFLHYCFTGKFTDSITPSESIDELRNLFEKKKSGLNKFKNKKFTCKNSFLFGSKLPKISKHWFFDSLDYVSESVESGSTPLRSEPKNFDVSGVPLLKVENIDDDGNVVLLDDQLRLSHDANLKQKKSILKTNDVLLNIVGPPLGEIGFVTKESSTMNINQALVLVRTLSCYNSKLLFFCLCSPFYQNLMYIMGRGNRQDNIKKSDIERISIPIMPLNHQQILSEKLSEFYLKKYEIFENLHSFENNLKKLEASIFNFAYSGRLVLQDSKKDIDLVRKKLEMKNQKL